MLSFYYFCNIFPARSLFTQKKLAKKTFAEKVLPLGAMEKRLCLNRVASINVEKAHKVLKHFRMKKKENWKKTVEKKVPSHGKEIGFQGTDLSSFTAFTLTMGNHYDESTKVLVK